MNRVRPGTVMIRVMAVFFALVSAFTSYRYFNEKSADESDKRVPAPAISETPTIAPVLSVLPSGVSYRDAKLPAPTLAADFGVPGQVIYVRVEADQIAAGSRK